MEETLMDYKTLHFNSLVVDTHCDTLLRVVKGDYKLHEENPVGHVDIPRLRKGGVGVQFFAAYISAEYKPDRSTRRFLQLCDSFYTALENNASDLHLILKTSDIDQAQSEGKIGAFLSVEGGEALEGDLAVLRMLYRLGVRAIGLTWNERNQIAEGLGECRSGGGLTDFGVQVVQEMNRLGMIVDVSHISEPGFWDCIKVSKHPIIASHSNAKAVCNHARNLTDEQIKALARNGGVMGMNMAVEFLHTDRPVTVDHVVDHIEHIVNLVGSKHVGIGADYDGIGKAPEGLENVAGLPLLTEALLRRGFNEEQVRDILGLNFRRVMTQVLG